MRSFLIANSYGNGYGQVAIYGNRNGEFEDINANGRNIKEYSSKEFQLVLHRSANDGGDIVLPFYPYDFSYARSIFQEPVNFMSLVKVPAPTRVGDYSIMIIKKGVGFNERNKWTATVHVTDTSITAEELSNLLVKAIKSNSAASGVTAGYQKTGDIGLAIMGLNDADYEIKGADNLTGVKVEVKQNGWKGNLTPSHVKDLLDKAAADAGYEYTYSDNLDKLYPGYFNKAENDLELSSLVTIRFAEPRQVRTVDHEINQIIQIGFKEGSDEFIGVLSYLLPNYSNIDSGSAE